MGFGKKFRDWIGKPKSAGYKQHRTMAFNQARDLPLFDFFTVREMLHDPTIRLGLAMRSAPLGSAEFAYKTEGEWKQGIQASSEEVAKFVSRQLKRIWAHDLSKILTSQVWGWSGSEVTYREVHGRVEVDRILHRHAEDVFALLKDGELAGVQVRQVKGKGSVNLTFPNGLWHSFNPEGESPYGLSILRGAYSPWADKQLNGGACDVRRLFMHKDAYGGSTIKYPSGTTFVDGDEIPNRDIVREMVEQEQSGAVTTMPSEVDAASGKAKWEMERATVTANPAHILQFPKDLDTEMLRGLEIPDDVITAEATGAWQGKQVPMQAFYMSADRWLAQVVQAITLQILEPLVKENFGSDAEFQVQTKPLAEQAMDQMKAAEQPEGGAPGQANPQTAGGMPPPGAPPPNGQPQTNGKASNPFLNPPSRSFSLGDSSTAEMLVGRGVVQASHLVDAGRKFLDSRSNGRTRFKVAHAPKGGVSVGGKDFRGGQFIPGAVLDEATDAELAAIEGKAPSEAKQTKTPTTEGPVEQVAIRGRDMDVQQRGDQWWFQRKPANPLDESPGWTSASPAMSELIENTIEDAKPKAPQRRVGPAIVNLDDISIDPGRFQYKVSDIGEGGVTKQFSDVDFNPELAGMLYVWNDPGDGKTYVINGHHRYQLAKQSGWEGELPVRYIDRDTPEEARAFGALINIAQGNGTALDAAKFMRDMGFTGAEGIDYFKEHNVSLKGAVAADAISLANLSDNVFRELAFGRVSLPHARAIGEELQPGTDETSREAVWTVQNKLMKRIQDSKGRLPESVVREMAVNASEAPRVSSSQPGLFGDQDDEILFEDRARVQAGVRTALTKDVQGFGAVASQGRADLLRESGVGDVSSATAGEKKSEAETTRETFDRELRFRGDSGDDIKDILNEAARAHSRATTKGQKSSIIKAAVQDVRQLLGQSFKITPSEQVRVA